jgi:hypothetical protein
MKIMPNRRHKFFSFPVAALASAIALVSFSPGCEGEPIGDGCFDYSSFESDARTVGFKADVLPIFQGSCTFSSTCHGAVSGSLGKVYLGPNSVDTATDMDITNIFNQTVGVASSELTTMKIVEASSPEKSFLMYKMDGKLTCADPTCAGCGVPMPSGQPKVDETKLETVRLWIAQGAKND